MNDTRPSGPSPDRPDRLVEEDRGIRCPSCGCPRHFVVYTRRVSDRRISRARECEHCGRRFSTVERVNAHGGDQK